MVTIHILLLATLAVTFRSNAPLRFNLIEVYLRLSHWGHISDYRIVAPAAAEDDAVAAESSREMLESDWDPSS